MHAREAREAMRAREAREAMRAREARDAMRMSVAARALCMRRKVSASRMLPVPRKAFRLATTKAVHITI